MKDGLFIIDGIGHAQEMRPDRVLPLGSVLRDLNQAVHGMLPPEYAAPGSDAWEARPSADHMCNAYFRESDVDVAVTHHLPLYSYVTGGLVTIESNEELAARAPQRWIVYAGVDPSVGVAQAIESLDKQIDAVPSIVGLKLYPASLDPLRMTFLDDKNLFPLWQHVQDRGLKVISVHKAVPYGPVPISPFKVADVEGAAGAFPDLNFEIMHGGMAFTEETALMIGRFPNVYTNLEGTSLLAHLAPVLFERVLAEFIFRGGSDKVIWGTGGPQLCHPQLLLDALLDFQFSDAILDEWRIPQITMDQKADILGRTFASMIGLDMQTCKAEIEDDEYSQWQREHGRAAPFSQWEPMTPNVQPDPVATV